MAAATSRTDEEHNPSSPSYIDYETFLSPSFDPHAFANSLIHATNNPTDTPLDLSTPLQRVLFDVQEVDTHIDNLTSKSALPLLENTRDQVHAGGRILDELETQVKVLADGYDRLKREVGERHEAAQGARVAAERVWRTLRLGRVVGRCISLGRQLEVQMVELQQQATSNTPNAHGATPLRREDHRAMLRAATTIVPLRQIFASASLLDHEATGLDRITVARALRTDLVDPAERRLLSRAEQIVGQFSMSALTGTANATESGSGPPAQADHPGMTTPSFPQTEDTRARATSALSALYLLSPVAAPPRRAGVMFEPVRLVSALQEYLRRAITSSLAGVSQGLGALPRLDRALLETAARCQNIVALEILLAGVKPPSHPMLASAQAGTSSTAGSGTKAEDATKAGQQYLFRPPHNLLEPLLTSLDTSSLPSYFWRSMASQLTGRVQRILKEGGVPARTLRSNRDKVASAIRSCVGRGSRLPVSAFGGTGGRDGSKRGGGRDSTTTLKDWEREATVMVASVVNVLGR